MYGGTATLVLRPPRCRAMRRSTCLCCQLMNSGPDASDGRSAKGKSQESSSESLTRSCLAQGTGASTQQQCGYFVSRGSAQTPMRASLLGFLLGVNPSSGVLGHTLSSHPHCKPILLFVHGVRRLLVLGSLLPPCRVRWEMPAPLPRYPTLVFRTVRLGGLERCRPNIAWGLKNTFGPDLLLESVFVLLVL